MPKNVKRSDAKSAIQKRRTTENKKRKYEKLISLHPNDAHISIWKNILSEL